MDVKRFKLKELLTIGNGKDYSSLGDGIYPVYGSGGFMRSVDSYLYEGESVLLPRKGTLSNIQFVSGKFWTVDTCYYSKINKSIVLPYYLFRLLRSFDLSGFDSGASIPSMTSKTYYSIKIDLPDIMTQKKISNVLLRYDKLIEVNNNRIKALEKIAENLYKEWFVRFRFPGYENAEFENGIPKDWDVLKVSDFALIKAGGDRPDIFSDIITEKCSIPVYSNGLEKEGLYGYTDKAIIHDESITISARGTVGFVCYRRTPFVPIVRLIAIVPNIEIVTPLYMFYYFKNDSIIANGTSQQQITIPMVSRKKVLLPSKKVLQEFGNLEKPLWDCIDKLKEKNKNLIKQRDLLLPRLMSGKLEV